MTPRFTSRLRAAPPAVLALLILALPAAAQLGPYRVVTKQAVFEASLYKRDKDILWVERKSSSGARSPQVGIAVGDIQFIHMPRPGLFEQVERLLELPKPPAKPVQAAHSALDKFILQTRSMRDIPGIHANEAILLKGRLYAHGTLWREAIRQFENVVTYAAETEWAGTARLLAGIAYAKSGGHLFAVEYLADQPLPEDDEALLSDMLYALGSSYAALGNYDNALLAYLPLVVFYPYIQDNEPRALAATLECYAELREWEPLYRAIQDIKRLYPNTPADEAANEAIAKYEKDLREAGKFVDGTAVVAPTAGAAP
ncbi:MAG: hypothetical protein GX803_08800 [Lentisphaerae bacterium]|jgi:tetratricopeptide (TPR) repeat protein|nr:hypothetical protein [Lentisphaerota bacterium]